MKYRIVRDSYAGYEVQYLRGWWIFKFWRQGTINTHSTLEKAREYAHNGDVIEQGEV